MNAYLNDLYVLLIGTIVALNSISIPVSYQIISTNLKQLLSRDSHLILLEEQSFRGNIFASAGCLILYFCPLIFDFFPNPASKSQALFAFQVVYLVLTVISALGFFLAFGQFSYRIYEYSSNAEDIIFEKAKKKADEFLAGR